MIQSKYIKFKNLLYLLKHDIAHYYYKLTKTVKPSVINLNANDICNSKCVMCNIWQQKKEFEISGKELSKILSQPFYKNVSHVGITGGEPTLREDIIELYEACINTLPNLQGLSIITNAIKDQEVIEKIYAIANICSNSKINFSVMVSLDGINEIHDMVRGRSGNFNSAIRVINFCKENNIPYAIGSTISKINIYEVEETLYYLKENKIYGRFRIAEFIKRLYNEDRIEVIKNFDEDEIYFLTLFFYKLIFTFETNESYIRTYYNIINMLNGGKRKIGCPYKFHGIVLNSKGEISYCAPRSNNIGNALNVDSKILSKSNYKEKLRILNNECDNCIHDYHVSISFTEQVQTHIKTFWRSYYTIESRIPRYLDPILFKKRHNKHNKKSIFIMGWYGTETVGDKAILGGIVDDLIKKYKDIDLTIGSIYPLITERTIRELKITAKVVDIYSSELIKQSSSNDIIIMGGGPLMDLGNLDIPFRSFQIAKKNSKKTIIYGCGIGPLHEPIYINTVVEILKLSDDIYLRDKNSLTFAKKLLKNNYKNILLSGDFAKPYILKLKDSIKIKKSNVLNCYLRDWTYEYSKDISIEEFKILKEDFELKLSILIKQKAQSLKVEKITLYHMHNFVIGGDDRDFSRYFISKYFQDFNIKIDFDKSLSSVNTIIESMMTSRLNICMRFHSVLFAETLNTDFIAIDYTKGGKIFNYLNDINKLKQLISIDKLVSVNA